MRTHGFRALAASVLTCLLVLTGSAALPLRPAEATVASWVSPIDPTGGTAVVVRAFDPPPRPWQSGHRGVDLAAPAHATVYAAGAGQVTFAGDVARTGVVTVTHGGLRTTYQPVLPLVRAGATVRAGQPIGLLMEDAGHCPGHSCLHWGLRSGDTYLDPMSLLAPQPASAASIRLLPLGERTLTEAAPPPLPVTRGDGPLGWPVANPVITSPFGLRVHPITGIHKLHDGTDFGAACGTPVFASADGTVAWAGGRGAYGRQVRITHPGAGALLATSYSHLSALAVAGGQPVSRGQVVGAVGTTGLSTGCHLHFMVERNGTAVDPLSYLGG